MPTKQKPPIECRSGRALTNRDDQGDFFIPDGTVAIVTVKSVLVFDRNDTRFEIPRADFDKLVRWYTGTEKKARSR